MLQTKVFSTFIITSLLFGLAGFIPDLQAQQTPNMQNYQALSSFATLNQQIKKPPSLTTQALVISIDENEYEVDSGDEFYIRIDVEGPDVKIFKSTVSADGMLVFPEVPAIKVRGLILKEAKKQIIAHLKKFYKVTEIDVALAKVHHVRISVIGALQPASNLNLTSADHLVDAIQKIVTTYQSDSSHKKLLYRASMRRIDLIRNHQKNHLDLLRFLRIGDQSQNPLLKTNDIIYVHYRDSLAGNIRVSGQVGSPGIYEFIPGDNVASIIALAGGMLTAADSNRIEIYRRSNPAHFRKVITFKQDSLFPLASGDQIFVRAKTKERKQNFVKIEGEVKYPGLYPIVEGQTKLSDILNWSGGFTKEADIHLAYVKRKLKMIQSWREINRILESQNTSIKMSTTEQSYLKEYFREKFNIIQVDFNKILKNPNLSNNIFLKNNDLISVPSKTQFILISGGVKKPGIYPYIPKSTIKDYVQLAGGYSSRKKKSLMKIIKVKNGAWLDANENTIPEQSDQIFIPRRSELELWPVFKEALSLIVQVGTVFVIIRSTR